MLLSIYIFQASNTEALCIQSNARDCLHDHSCSDIFWRLWAHHHVHPRVSWYLVKTLTNHSSQQFHFRALRNQYFRISEEELNYFADYYAPSHMNIGNYFIGVAVGFMYYHLKKNNINVSKILVSELFEAFKKAWIVFYFQWFRMLWYSCVVIGFISILIAFVFYSNDFETTSIWQALLSIFLKHTWGLVMAVGIIGFIYRYGWFLPNIFNYGAWRIIGRISYASFICHLFILKLLMSSIHQPMYLSVYNVVSFQIHFKW